MKKMTLLFIILCTSALNAMEVEHNYYVGMSMQDLPKEIQSLIIGHLNTGDTVKNVIKTIMRMSRTNTTFNTIIKDIYDNQKNFITLIQTLANNFHTNPSHIAEQFKTPTSEKYIRLGKALLTIVRTNDFLSVAGIIGDGADINYYDEMNKLTPLVEAIRYQNANMVKLILDLGADPYFTGPYTESYAMKVLKEEKVSEQNEKIQYVLKATTDMMA